MTNSKKGGKLKEPDFDIKFGKNTFFLKHKPEKCLGSSRRWVTNQARKFDDKKPKHKTLESDTSDILVRKWASLLKIYFWNFVKFRKIQK